MNCSSETLSLMETLTQAIGVSGQERQVCRLLADYYKDVADQVVRDYNGSLFAVKRSKAPDPFRVMVAAHSDEVGLVVRQIRPNGLIRAHIIGGLWDDVLPGARVRMRTDQGREFRGCVSALSTKVLRERIGNSRVPLDQLYLDFGFLSEEDARSQGVLEGCQIVVDGPFEVLNGGRRLLSKAWDDRFGCILGVELLRSLRDVELPFDLYVGADVQEEVGLRGARTASNLVNPDLAIIWTAPPPTTWSASSPPTAASARASWSASPTAPICPTAPCFSTTWTCSAAGISLSVPPVQGRHRRRCINTSGLAVPALTACICARNVHTGSLMIDAGDYLHCLEAVTAFVSQLDREKLERYRNNNA